MKCLAIRLGEEYRDRDDILVLLRALNLRSVAEVEPVLARYYPLERYPAKARYVLEDLLESPDT
jgi:hypothetical protein